ncbi:unnamed protein product [Penicillium salamii]|uniref:RING-CH-type domain-containing protein n=1 Tax=Penicillium salamii TaxID=1612424 RepID=A0A9W4J2D3_9EURO|nr:unnamed protein product [Penicillium salamii]CAG8008197.1 unnamed protein product [Penicillium salamii]CAG8031123.1 unnamed protein product [Penicillium salamii]CAG8318948.1 unnamed protein product [Penicillium salamii]CAG8359247.1 unnamed protein product [Penicillium salamii]
MTLELPLHPLCIRAGVRRPLGQCKPSIHFNSVSWHVSPARPAILTSVTDIRAGVQDLSLQNLSLSEDVDEIHCVFCLAENEEQASECVILRNDRSQAHCHLSCAEEWLEKRRAGFGTSCCVWLV